MGDSLGSIIGASISASADTTNTGITGLVNLISNRKTNRTNERINQQNIQANIDAATTAYERQQELNTTAFERSEIGAVNAWERSEQSAENAYQRMLEQWQRETQYNSPFQQMERYREAGLNPAVMMSGQNAVASSATPLGAASSPSASSSAGSAPQASFGSMIPMQPFHLENYQPGQAMANVFNLISQASKNFSESSRSDAEARSINSQLDLVLRNMQADALGKEITNQFLPFVQKGNIEKNAAEVFTYVEQALKANADAKVSVAEEALKRAQEKTEHWRSKEQKVLAETAFGRIQSQIDLNKANASNARSSSALTDEETSQLREMHSDNVKMKQFLMQSERYKRDITGFEWQKLSSTLADQIKVIRNNNLASSRQLDILEQELRKAKTDNDLRAYHEVLDALERINNGVTNWIPFAPDKTVKQDVWIDSRGNDNTHTSTIYKSRW